MVHHATDGAHIQHYESYSQDFSEWGRNTPFTNFLCLVRAIPGSKVLLPSSGFLIPRHTLPATENIQCGVLGSDLLSFLSAFWPEQIHKKRQCHPPSFALQRLFLHQLQPVVQNSKRTMLASRVWGRGRKRRACHVGRLASLC